MKKILIASGCSFTEKKFTSTFHPEMDCTWDKWPELLAQKLDMDCINLGSRGAGNEYIYNSIVQKLLKIKKNRVGLVMAGWSSAERFNFRVIKNSMGEHVHRGKSRFKEINQGVLRHHHIDNFPNRDYSMSKLYPSVVKSYPSVDKLDHYEYITNRSIGLFFNLQILCKNFEIPLKQFQMIDLFVNIELGANTASGNKEADDNEKAKMMMRSPYLECIDEESFIGWPISFRLGGYNLWGHILNQDFYSVAKQNLQISNEDAHPNALAQQQITDFLYEKIKD